MDTFDLESRHGFLSCVYDSLVFIDDVTGSGVEMCGSDNDGCDFVSSGNSVTVVFSTDGSETGGGFSLNYEAVAPETQAQDQCGNGGMSHSLSSA